MAAARESLNKVVVVTGGASGIGYEIVTNFLKNGVSRAVILDLNETIGNEAVKNLSKIYGDKIDFMKCDVTKDLNAVSTAIFEQYKTVDILVNNAGIINELQIDKTIAINITAVINWTFKFKEHMRIDKGGKGGTIINLASIYGYRNDPYLPVYKASKYAVLGFTKTIGHENNFNRTGVRVVALCPSYTRTNLGADNDLPDIEEKEELARFLESPARMWQEPEAVGKAAVEVFKVADSGTAWLIEGGKPIEKVE